MKKKIIMGFSLFFVLMFSTVIVATPPSGNPPIGTSWCENSATGGNQMYTYEGGGNWAGPYACPGGCSSLGLGGSCAAPKPCKKGDDDGTKGNADAEMLAPADDTCVYA